MSEELRQKRRALHRQLNRRSPLVHTLDARFSPTAIYPDSGVTASLVIPSIQPISTTAPSSSSVLVQSSTSTTPVQAAPTTIATTSSSSPSIAAVLTTSTTTSSSQVVTTSSTQSTSSTSAAAAAAATTTTTTATTAATISSSSHVAAVATTQAAVTQTATWTTVVHTIGGSTVAVSSAAASASSTSTPSSATSTGAIVGGVVAAIIGTIGIVAAVVYFLRKSRNGNDNQAEISWNADDVRRQSTMLNDDIIPPSRALTYNRGAGGTGSPRPPTMIERKLTNASPAMLQRAGGNMYGGYGPAGNSGHQSFSPGEIVSPMSPPPTATSANPFITPYDTPMASPVRSIGSPYSSGAPYADPAPPQAAFMRQSSTSYVTRQNSVGGAPFSPVSPMSPGTTGYDTEDPHYVDLSRSSVTPFQAAQYEEISRKLGAPAPGSLALGPVNEESNLPYPGTAVTSDTAIAPSPACPHTLYSIGLTLRDSDTSVAGPPVPTKEDNGNAAAARVSANITDADMEADAQELEFPAPPAALHHARIDSTPPVLPEIALQNRSFSPVSYDFPLPVSARSSPSPFRTQFGDVRAPPPVAVLNKSSPLATAVPVQAPQPEIQPAEAPRRDIRAEGTQIQTEKRPDTMYSAIYDEEDAYGGI
ncbi:hypothetical protein EW146_g4042 [Bondarzewia mesenterica]|uniref:Uncharacterized protein n=1 Tax=Bondarzewia mesenterica TaxID=1095465 RepID=A0A4S4LVS4_9AGAM|nr:hypothetical protein EW146_g4042 [Bondarzewia mesenterica]